MKLICFNSDRTEKSEAAQERLAEFFKPYGYGILSCSEYSDVKEFFACVADAFGGNRLVVLAVENNAFLKIRAMVFKALAIKSEFSSTLASLIANNVIDISDDEREKQCFTAKGATVLESPDGLYSGFALSRAGQTVVYLPLDDARLKGMLENAPKGVFGKTEPTQAKVEQSGQSVSQTVENETETAAEVVAPTVVPEEPISAGVEEVAAALQSDDIEPSSDEAEAETAQPESQAVAEESGESTDASESEYGVNTADEGEDKPSEEPQPDEKDGTGEGENGEEKSEDEQEQTEQDIDLAAACVKKLIDAKIKVAVAQTPASPYINESCMSIDNFFEAVEFTQYSEKRGDTKPTDHVACLAKGAAVEAGTDIGVAVSKVFTAEEDGEEKMFIYVALANNEIAKVKRIFANPGENPVDLVAVAIETMYGMILQYLAVGMETSQSAQTSVVSEQGESEQEQSYSDPNATEPMEKKGLKIFGIVIAVVLSVALVVGAGFGIYYKMTGNNLLAVALAAFKTLGESQVEITEPEKSEGDINGEVLPITEPESESETAAEESTDETETQTETTTSEKTTAAVTTTAAPTTAASGKFKVTTYGYGHGVGMSQWGAYYYAKDGWSYDKILSHYYPGASLESSTAPSTLTYAGGSVKTDEIIARILDAEMGKNFPSEALKAQAVAAYTYVMGNNGKVSGLAVSSNEPSSVALEAARAVLGQTLKSGGSYINAVFYSMSAGKTCAADNAWSSSVSYLPGGIDSAVDKRVKNYKVVTTYTADEMRKMIKNAYGIEVSGSPATWLSVISHDGAVNSDIGYVKTLSINGQKTVKGLEFRYKMGWRSHCFTVEYSA